MADLGNTARIDHWWTVFSKWRRDGKNQRPLTSLGANPTEGNSTNRRYPAPASTRAGRVRALETREERIVALCYSPASAGESPYLFGPLLAWHVK